MKYDIPRHAACVRLLKFRLKHSSSGLDVGLMCENQPDFWREKSFSAAPGISVTVSFPPTRLVCFYKEMNVIK